MAQVLPVPGDSASMIAALSDDGQVMAGTVHAERGTRALRIAPDSATILLPQVREGYHEEVVYALSADGRVAIGSHREQHSSIDRAVIWSGDDPPEVLPGLHPAMGSSALAIRADGAVIGGSAAPLAGGTLPVLWTRGADGWQLTELPLPVGVTSASVRGISDDGAVMLLDTLGTGVPARRPALRGSDGRVTFLDPLDGHGFVAGVALSGDGRVVVGYSWVMSVMQQPQPVALRWIEGGPPLSLGALPGGNLSEAHAVSGDGTHIAGWSRSTEGVRAFVWSVTGGMRALPMPEGARAAYARAISRDGARTAGEAMLSSGGFRAVAWTEPLP